MKYEECEVTTQQVDPNYSEAVARFWEKSGQKADHIVCSRLVFGSGRNPREAVEAILLQLANEYFES